MRRRKALGIIGGIATWPFVAGAQSGKIVRIGWLTAQRPQALAPFIGMFRAGLTDLGYVEGRNLAIEYRYGDDTLARVPELAAELVRFPVDLIVAQGAAVAIVSKLDLPVPIIYAYSGDPVSAGFAESLARPLRNMTGLTFMATELSGKRLEILRELIPELRSVAILANPQHPGEHLERAASEEAGRRLGLTTTYYATRTSEELTGAFEAMTSNPPQAISLFSDAFATQNRHRTMEFSQQYRIPVISGWRIFAESGAVCAYGPALAQSYRRLASYVDRILKGSKPADLPIERPTTFELVLNQRSANALRLTIPASLLARADEVIE